jgi:serine/threonine-protein kinase
MRSTGRSSFFENAPLQERVAQFGMATACLGATFLLFRLVMGVIALGRIEAPLAPDVLLHALAVAILAFTWLVNRRGKRSIAFVQATEAFAFLGSATAYIAMGAFIVSPASVFVVLLALTYTAAARAAYVPTTPLRSAVLTGVLGVPLVLLAVRIEQLLSPGVFKGDQVAFSAAATAVWWLLTTMLATGISHVVYGLRREVHDVKRLGQYTLEEKLGEGGMGVVFRAQHALLRRPTAVKLLPADRAGKTAIARFEREVQLTALLTHPNTVTIFDYGRTPDNIFYYAMELLEGATLTDVVAVGGAVTPARAAKVLREVAGALEEAHGVGLIHRDIKPENILLARIGGVPDVPKVVDFGLVKEVERDQDAALTATDTITGTPQYMAPESITAPETVDGRSDLYALGAVGYFLVTGRHVFEGKSIVEIASHHLHSAPEPPSARLGRPIPADFEKLLLDCLAKNPSERPASAAAMIARIEACRDLGEWTRADAEAWREEHARAIAQRRRKSRDSKPGTIEIDVSARRPLESIEVAATRRGPRVKQA